MNFNDSVFCVLKSLATTEKISNIWREKKTFQNYYEICLLWDELRIDFHIRTTLKWWEIRVIGKNFEKIIKLLMYEISVSAFDMYSESIEQFYFLLNEDENQNIRILLCITGMKWIIEITPSTQYKHTFVLYNAYMYIHIVPVR